MSLRVSSVWPVVTGCSPRPLYSLTDRVDRSAGGALAVRRAEQSRDERQHEPDHRDHPGHEGGGTGCPGIAEQQAGDEAHRSRDRRSQEGRADDGQLVRCLQQLTLAAVPPHDAVEAGGGDQEHRGRRSRQEGGVIDVSLQIGDAAEALRERHRQQEPEQHLDAGEHHPQLVQELHQLAIVAVVGGLVLVRVRRFRRFRQHDLHGRLVPRAPVWKTRYDGCPAAPSSPSTAFTCGENRCRSSAATSSTEPVTMKLTARAIAVRNARSYRNSLPSAANSSAMPAIRRLRRLPRSEITTSARPVSTQLTDTSTWPCWKRSCTSWKAGLAPCTSSWPAPRIAAASVHSATAQVVTAAGLAARPAARRHPP